MYAQRGIKTGMNPNPLRMGDLRSCLELLRFSIVTIGIENDGTPLVVMPKIGAGLGGGDWGVIQALIAEVFNNTGIDVHICEFQ
jgi:hypothetical protein